MQERDDIKQDNASSPSTVVAKTTGKRPQSIMSLAAQTSVQSFQDLRCGYYQAIMRGQVQQVEGIKTEIIKHFQEVKTEPDKLNADLEKNAELQDKLVKMGETMLKMQELSLNRLTSSQTQIQAVPTLTYELQAYLSRGYSSSSPELNDGETESYCLSLSNMSVLLMRV